MAARVAFATGSSWAFVTAVSIIIGWALTGPLFHFSDTWQLVINTSTTIITFLMVFLIQNTQNRDSRALHLKLDELIRAQDGARNNMIDLDRLTDAELEALHQEFLLLTEQIAQQQPSESAAPGTAPLRTPRQRPPVVDRVVTAVAHELKKRHPHSSHPKPPTP
jgi:low affinity Fe/Cu permease